jgi:hypothetical protein
MKIQPVTTDAIQPTAKARPKVRADAVEPQDVDGQQKTGRKERLKEALLREPAVRPEMLERAKRLAADPDYPSKDMLAHIAETFIADVKRTR